MAELVAEGTLVTDVFKKQWKVGPVVGKGGFGLIYLSTFFGAIPMGSL